MWFPIAQDASKDKMPRNTHHEFSTMLMQSIEQMVSPKTIVSVAIIKDTEGDEEAFES
jgi:hypothetical protein